MKTLLRNLFLFTASLSLLTACNSVYQYEGDCSVNYRLQFVDDIKLNFSDAFHQEVNSLTVYVFNEDGTYVCSKSESGATLHPADGQYSMNLSDLPAGNYHLVAWGGLEDNNAFRVPELTPGVSKLDDLTCTLNRVPGADGVDLVNTDLDPLFHGMLDITIPEVNTEGTYYFTMSLLKNTNSVNVVLQQLNGESLNSDDYDFIIEADNGHLNHDNSILNDEPKFIYTSWNQQGGVAAISAAKQNATKADNEDYTQVSAVVANLTISRIVERDDWSEYTRPTLTVYNRATQSVVLSIPLIDYALLIRGNYPRIASSQDYLDRQDEYNMTFFLNNGQWLSNEIIINSWKIMFLDNEF
jgi:hypothetical protein